MALKTYVKILLSALFVLIYSLLFSLGIMCLFQIFGVAMAISLDGKSVVDMYPRFIPFCFAVGFFALFAIIGAVILNYKYSEKLKYTKHYLGIQLFCSFIISIPLMKIWEMAFEFLQKTF